MLTNSSDFSFSRSSRGDSLASTSNMIVGGSPVVPTPSRSSTAAIVRHRFLLPRDFLLTGLRPESRCLIRELIQEKRPTRLLSQTGPRIPSAGADAGRAFPGCLNRPVVEERHLQATANCLPIMRCEIRCSNPPYCLARGRKANSLSAPKPLFCMGMRRIARRCQHGKLPVPDG